MQFNTASSPVSQLVFENEILEIWKEEVTDQHSTFSRINLREGNTICDFGASAIVQTPSYLTVQLNTKEHIYLQPSFLQYINHSCCPNVFFDTTSFKVISLRDIKIGDELCYFYPSTEWKMSQPFQCVCGCDNCLGYIGGASYLSQDVLQRYRFSDFISEQLKIKYSK
ncbi:MAG TPA: SET domain-containing protein-lysine N-methyltransferase [Chitinophagaceae bacterium]